MFLGADLQGGSGLGPYYITLTSNQTMRPKPLTVTLLSAGSTGVGIGGIACFGDLTDGIGGVGTVYANGGGV